MSTDHAMSGECQTIQQKPFRQIAENHFGNIAELSLTKLPIRPKSIRQLCIYTAANMFIYL